MFYNVIQNTPEWNALRLGKVTSSNQSKIMANYGKAFGNPAIEYAQQKALEIVTGQKDEVSRFKGDYFDRGHELEPLARIRYEEETFSEVTNGGFYVLDDEQEIKLGDSNDGNVGTDGCVEIKCVIPSTQWKRIKKNSFDTAYKFQVHSHIWIGGKQWCDFVSFCPEMPYEKQIVIHRVNRDEEVIKMLESRNSLFRDEIKKNIKYLNQ